jgi:hypothetical protein
MRDAHSRRHGADLTVLGVEVGARFIKDACVIGLRACFFGCIAVLCIARPARAQHSAGEAIDVSLDYSVLPGCPDASTFRAIVNKRLGYDPFSEQAAERVQVVVSAGDSGLEGRVVWRDSVGNWAGERIFPSRSDDCGDLIRAMGFALAVQIQLLAVAGGPNPAHEDAKANEAGNKGKPPPRSSVPPPNANPPVPSDATGPTRGRASAARLLVVGGGSLGFGLASGVVPMARLAVGVAWTHLQLELGGEFGLPATNHLADGSGYSEQLMLASAAGCGVYQPFSACLLTKAGAVRVRGKGVDLPESASGPVLEFGLRGAARLPLGPRMYLAANAEGLFTLVRWTVTLDDAAVWSAPRLAGVLGLDFGLLFP